MKTISVITVNRDNREGLRKTIESVATQTVRPYEFIIIDGLSSDGSADLLKEYAGDISYCISEKDTGIYNAMNKGVAHANGEWCIFMNSGDVFSSPAVIGAVASCGAAADMICGNTRILEDPPRIKKAPEEVTLKTLWSQALCHQSVFIRTSLLRAAPYDEGLKIVSDRKFFLQQLIFENATYEAVDIDVVDYDITGYSAKNRFASEMEWRQVLRQLIPQRILQDYGAETDGPLYGDSPYEQLFLEIKKRKWRKPVYRIAHALLDIAAVFVPSASFVRLFPSKIE